jgi:hypothetical protein
MCVEVGGGWGGGRVGVDKSVEIREHLFVEGIRSKNPR